MARPRAADYDEKRRQLLHACADLFARQGYDRTSINDIAAACGVSKALVYHYYPNKEQLLVDIIRRHLADLVETVEAAVRHSSEAGRLRAIIHALLEAYRDADALHKIQVNELSRLPQESQGELKSAERQLVVLFSEALAAAVPGLGGSPLLKPVTMSLFGMLNWHYMWFRPEGTMSREAYADLATDLIIAGARDVVSGARRVAAE
jgi:TetR/AcrR family transcriptional regulator